MRCADITTERLVEICMHELRLEEVYDIKRLITKVKIVLEDSNDTYRKLTKKHRINARETLSGYMLAWDYVEDLDGSGLGQRLWNGKVSRPNTLIWPEERKKWGAMTMVPAQLADICLESWRALRRCSSNCKTIDDRSAKEEVAVQA